MENPQRENKRSNDSSSENDEPITKRRKVLHCIHNRRRYDCVECKGPSICEHNKRKYECRQCSGARFCEHNKRKNNCKECKGDSLYCIHNRRKYDCIECKGPNICVHNKRKYDCRQCNGARFCEHGRIKSNCKECKGGSICEHNKIKYDCIICKGPAMCEHGRRRNCCIECKGSRLCEHNKIRTRCVECKGSQICEHNKIRNTCRQCKGASICEHGKRKHSCIDCKGTSICEHGKIKYACRQCGGSKFCQHNKSKTTCVECKGSQICEHNKMRNVCRQCNGRRLCKSSWCETIGNKKYNGYCLLCFVHQFPDEKVARNYKTKEKSVAESILEAFPNFTWNTDRRIEDGCSRRRPDLFLDMGSHVIIVEVDENQHITYDCSCENKRLMEISQDVGHRPIVFIRFNPDEYINKEGYKINSCWKYSHSGLMRVQPSKQNEWRARINCLLENIAYWLENPTDKTIQVVELFYSSNSNL